MNVAETIQAGKQRVKNVKDAGVRKTKTGLVRASVISVTVLLGLATQNNTEFGSNALNEAADGIKSGLNTAATALKDSFKEAGTTIGNMIAGNDNASAQAQPAKFQTKAKKQTTPVSTQSIQGAQVGAFRKLARAETQKALIALEHGETSTLVEKGDFYTVVIPDKTCNELPEMPCLNVR